MYDKEKKEAKIFFSSGPIGSTYLIMLYKKNDHDRHNFIHIEGGEEEELNAALAKLAKERRIIKNVYDLSKNFGAQYEKFNQKLLAVNT